MCFALCKLLLTSNCWPASPAQNFCSEGIYTSFCLQSISVSSEVVFFAVLKYYSESGWQTYVHMAQTCNHSKAAQHLCNTLSSFTLREDDIHTLSEHSLPLPVLARKYVTTELLSLNSRVTPQTSNLISALKRITKSVFHIWVWRARRWTPKDSEGITIIVLKKSEVSALEQ